MDDPTQEQVRTAAEEAVGVFLSKLGAELSNGRYVLMVEAIGLEGQRGLWIATPKEQTSWDSLGLLTYGIQLEQAVTAGDTNDE